MSEPKDSVPIEYLRQILKYEPETGSLYWLTRAENLIVKKKYRELWNERYSGKPAGTLNPNGYIYVRVGKRAHTAHRLAFALHYGRYPKNYLDHINHDKSDNKIENIREVSSGENARNRSLFARNKSGACGVWFFQKVKRWRAQIGHNGGVIHLGEFHSFAEALEKRKEAEIRFGFHENHGGA